MFSLVHYMQLYLVNALRYLIIRFYFNSGNVGNFSENDRHFLNVYCMHILYPMCIIMYASGRQMFAVSYDIKFILKNGFYVINNLVQSCSILSSTWS